LGGLDREPNRLVDGEMVDSMWSVRKVVESANYNVPLDGGKQLS